VEGIGAGGAKPVVSPEPFMFGFGPLVAPPPVVVYSAIVAIINVSSSSKVEVEQRQK
jgi:hypothetical protein